LTFAAFALATNPDIQEKLAEEVSQAMENNDGQLTYEVTHQMTYLDQFISGELIGIVKLYASVGVKNASPESIYLLLIINAFKSF